MKSFASSTSNFLSIFSAPVLTTVLGTVLGTVSLAAQAQEQSPLTTPKLEVCGARGAVEARIADCFKKSGDNALVKAGEDQSFEWKLVSRQADEDTSTYRETWLDTTTGVTWGARLLGTFEFDEATKACARLKNSELPTKADYVTGDEHGMRDVLKNLSGKIFWTQSPSDYPTAAYYYNGTEGFVEDGDREVSHSVRCIIRSRFAL